MPSLVNMGGLDVELVLEKVREELQSARRREHQPFQHLGMGEQSSSKKNHMSRRGDRRVTHIFLFNRGR